ncbi:MAG TPA: hypothetical protein PKA54_03745 [Chitinophagaceae bacterium]|nr:MAG: capsule polysaccharide export protein [Bacteroidetes bacterium OLB11]HMN32461.1 hypothetical protein [Chitinophagaceae bacterium]
MNNNKEFQFDLFDIIRIGLKWKKHIIIFSFAIACITAIIFLFQKNYYKAYGAFFPASAVISGRVTLFRETPQEWIDYFGGENEVDRAFVVGNSSPLYSYIIEKFKLREHYKIDSTDKESMKKTYKRFAKNFSISRTGFKNIEVTFTDEDQMLCHEVVNTAINQVESRLRELYIGINKQLALSIDLRKDSIANQLTLMTDSLITLRTKYSIYDIISPGRKNIINFTAKGSGEQYARGLEEIQIVEELKDKLAIDNARYMSLSNEFKTAIFDGFPMVHVTQWAAPGAPKAGPYRTIGVLISFVSAFVFGLLVSIVIEVLQENKHKMMA